MQILYKHIRDFIFQNTCTTLFFAFFLIYLAFGLYDFYFCEIITDIKSDLIYGMDIGHTFWRIYLNESLPKLKHPFIQILVYPFILLFKGFITNPKLIATILHSAIQSFIVCIIYKLLFDLTEKRALSLNFAILYGFSYTAILFAIYGEIYIWAGLSQILFFCYFLRCYKNNSKSLSSKNIFLLSFFTVISYGINLINIVSCSILLLILIFKIYKQQWKKVLINIAKVAGTIGLIIVVFVHLQSFSLDHQKRRMGAKEINFEYKSEKVIDAITGSYIEPFYAMKSKISDKKYKIKNKAGDVVLISRYMSLKKQNIFRYIPALVFLLIPVIAYLKNRKKYKNRLVVNSLMILVGLYTFFNYPFYSYECAIFALNYFPYLIILLGLLYEEITPVLRNSIIGLFLVHEILVNFNNLFKIHDFLTSLTPDQHSFVFCLFVSGFITLFASCLYFVFKRLNNKNNLYIQVKDPYLSCTVIYITLVAFYLISKLILNIIN